MLLFPDIPGTKSGYQIAVKSDLDRLQVTDDDVCLFHSSLRADNPSFRYINRPGIIGRVQNLAKLRVPSDLRLKSLDEVLHNFQADFDEIFCGDVTLYNAVRSCFPHSQIAVRFHNFYTKVLQRKAQLRIRVDPSFYVQLRIMQRLERKILLDARSSHIFISYEEQAHAQEFYPDMSTSTVWEIFDQVWRAPNVNVSKPRLIWFGGLSSHKKYGVDKFTSDVFPHVRAKIEGCEFHLYGAGTEQYDLREDGIYGHGFYVGNGVPDRNALYVNPDLLGGGVKLKIGHLLSNDCAFISTPYGVEGYQLPKSENILIRDFDNWTESIAGFFKNRI